ncbi:MAG: extracytoplasmic sigma factor ECF [Planctomycetota bacterium]|nr:MAG: extracytoplasmic sigma factor ECF [Planctomycetota bacterium]
MSSAPNTPDATELLRRVSAGEQDAEAPLLAALYDELRRLARQHMNAQSAAHTLQPTALVHEAWMRINKGGGWNGREHFLCFASRAMRSVLVDHARSRLAAKRGGDRERVPLDAAVESYESNGLDLLALEEALERLAQEEPDLVRIIELRFFGGLSMEETRRAAGCSLSTAERRWQLARIWLRTALASEGGHES